MHATCMQTVGHNDDSHRTITLKYGKISCPALETLRECPRFFSMFKNNSNTNTTDSSQYF